MSYSTPASKSVNDVLSAAHMNTLRSDLEWFANDHPRARVRRTTNQSIPNNAFTAITCDAERVDVGGCHSTSVNTSRLTVPTGGAGWYSMGGAIDWASSGTGVRIAAIRLNGSTILVQDRKSSVDDLTPTCSVATEYQLAEADYIELVGFQNSGGALNAVATAAYSCEVWFEWKAN